MKEFGYTFEDIRKMSFKEITFLLEGLQIYYRKISKSMRRKR